MRVLYWPGHQCFLFGQRGVYVLNTGIEKQPQRSAREAVDVTDVFCDFDGTITRVDATDAVLEAFALPAWQGWEQRWVNGEITSQECLARQVELIQADRETLAAFAANLPIDEGILDRRPRFHCGEDSAPARAAAFARLLESSLVGCARAPGAEFPVCDTGMSQRSRHLQMCHDAHDGALVCADSLHR